MENEDKTFWIWQQFRSKSQFSKMQMKRGVVYVLILAAFVSCTSAGTKQKNGVKNAQIKDTNNPLKDMTIEQKEKDSITENIVENNQYNSFEIFRKKKYKNQEDYDGFFNLMLTTNLEDLRENIGYFLETELKNPEKLKELLYYASINKDSAPLNVSLSSDFCNIYYMENESFERNTLQKKIEKDFSFVSEKHNKNIQKDFIIGLKKNVLSCYFK